MNLIANQCCGGWWYKLNNQEYGNPFMWSVVEYESMLNLLLGFNSINWGHIQLSPSPLRPNTFCINVDSLVTIHYMHCVYNKNITRPTIVYRKNIGNDVDYCSIWEYVYDKYIQRVKRMLSNGETPCFMLRTDKHNFLSDVKSLHRICEYDIPYKRIIFTVHNEFESSNPLCRVIHVKSTDTHKTIVTANMNEISAFIGK